MVTVGLYHYLFVSTILFSLGIFGIVTRKNAVMVLMGIELILNAANINFVAFARYGNFGFQGQLMALFVIVLAAAEAAIALAIVLNIYKVLAAAEAAIALAIVLNIYKVFSSVNVDEIDRLKE